MENNKIKIRNKEDELFHLYNDKSLYKIKKIEKNKNKCVGYSIINLISLFIKIIFLLLFTIIKLKNKINGITTPEINYYQSNTTILIVGIGKFENNYIREWVEYHKGIGINKIILCDNNPINGENLSEPIKDYVDSNFVEIDESFRGKSCLQLLCYEKHFKDNHMKYDWITFNDIDEFIFLEKGSGYTNIQQFLDEPIFNDTDNIILTWKYYDDNDILDVVNGNYSVLKRFTHYAPVENEGDPNSLSKAIYKGKVERGYQLGGHCIQGFKDSSGRKYVFRTADRKIMKFNSIGWCFYNFNKTHFPVSIHHFQLKSIGEYIKNKMLKGANEPHKYNFKFFFDINKLTKEKVQYALKILDKDKLKTAQYNLDYYINKTFNDK
jgi:hypothetical protein